jgi:hypothetical protein
LALGLWACPGGLAEAAELYADGRLRQQFEYDTNIDLSEDGRDAFGSRSTVGLTVGTRTPATNLALDGEFRLVRFFGESDLNSDDALVNALGSWNWARTALDLRAGVLRDTTRDLLDTETGTAAGENEERLTIDVESSIQHRFTPIQTGGLNLLYRKRIFPSLSSGDAEDLDLEEFSYYSLDGTWAYALSRALALRTVIGTSYFDSDQQESVSVQGRIGANYALTPVLRIDGTVGPTVIDTDAKGPLGDSGTTVGALWNLDVAYQPSADAALVTSFFQQLDPQSGGGQLELRTGLEVEFEYGLTRFTSFSLPALVQRQDPVEGDGDTRYYARVEPTLGFLLAPQLRLETAYRFRWQTFDGGDSDDATSHAVFISLTYDLPSLYTSR